MQLSDPEEVEAVLAFFRTYIDRELDVSISLFEGLIQRERLLVAEVTGPPSWRVLLSGPQPQGQLELHLHHYSFATVSSDHKKLEIGRILGGNVALRLTASEIES